MLQPSGSPGLWGGAAFSFGLGSTLLGWRMDDALSERRVSISSMTKALGFYNFNHKIIIDFFGLIALYYPFFGNKDI